MKNRKRTSKGAKKTSPRLGKPRFLYYFFRKSEIGITNQALEEIARGDVYTHFQVPFVREDWRD